MKWLITSSSKTKHYKEWYQFTSGVLNADCLVMIPNCNDVFHKVTNIAYVHDLK